MVWLLFLKGVSHSVSIAKIWEKTKKGKKQKKKVMVTKKTSK